MLLEVDYNVYCDESCHLKDDKSNVMVLGSMWCNRQLKSQIFNDIRQIKIKHGLSSWFEIKWTKVSDARIDFYLELINYFITNENIHFRGLIANKESLDHDRYNNGDYDLWYYKMYFLLLDQIITPSNEYYIFIDMKDTNGGHKIKKLHEVLCNNIYDFTSDVVRLVKQVNSKESELLQLADLVIGALGYLHRGLSTTSDSSNAKRQIIEALQQSYNLENNSPCREQKFNIFIWKGRN